MILRVGDLNRRESTMREREAGVEYFARPVSAREKELEERVEDVTLKGEVRDLELKFGGILAGLSLGGD